MLDEDERYAHVPLPNHDHPTWDTIYIIQIDTSSHMHACKCTHVQSKTLFSQA